MQVFLKSKKFIVGHKIKEILSLYMYSSKQKLQWHCFTKWKVKFMKPEIIIKLKNTNLSDLSLAELCGISRSPQ